MQESSRRLPPLLPLTVKLRPPIHADRRVRAPSRHSRQAHQLLRAHRGAHPITLNANSHGQLGFRKCDVPSPIDLEHFHLPHKHPRIPLELTPKSIADPYAKASPAIRPSSSLARSSEALVGKEAVAAGLDDANIRFSDRLFEVPALKGVKVDRVATGGRSSFVKTAAGKVLGWGANEFGYYAA
ncbi:hypothetical protein VTO73DRAFT_3598 [Trametes versicolor]